MIKDKEDFTRIVNEANAKINQAIKEFSNLNLGLEVEEVEKLEHKLSLVLKTISNNEHLNEAIGLELANTIRKIMQFHFGEFDKITKRMLDNLIEDISISLLFRVNPNQYQKYDKVFSFVKYLQELSIKTYETIPLNLGIIIIDNTKDVKLKLEKMKIEFLPKKQKVYIENLIKDEKPLLKLIDSKSYALVLDKRFYVIGFARKTKDAKSIDGIILENYFEKEYELFQNYSIKYLKELISLSYKDYICKLGKGGDNNKELVSMTEEQNIIIEALDAVREEFLSKLEQQLCTCEDETFEQINYIRIINTEIQSYFSNNYIMTLKNGKWRLKHFILLSSYIFEYLHIPDLALYTIYNEPSDLIEYIRQEIGKIFKLITIIRQMSEQNIGGLFIILKSNPDKKEIKVKDINKFIDSELIKIDKDKYYKSLIWSKEGKCMGIDMVDSYILSLIAGVDGATILDNNLSILTFGEITNNNITSNSNIYGGRTKAAISASVFGLAIKVSEDGDIELYKDSNLIFRV